MHLIDYQRFSWFNPDVIETVVAVMAENPEVGRPSLSKRTGLGMYKCEKILDIWRDYDLYQYLESEDPVGEILEALALTRLDQGSEEEEEERPYDPVEDFGPTDDQGESRFDPEDRYWYDASDDLYIVNLRFGKDDTRMVNVPGETHRAMREAYSDWDGNRQTLTQIAKEFGVSRRWFYAYKTALGWTHDQDPFTDAEVAATDPEELAHRAIQRKRHVMEKRYHQAQADQDRRDAERYRRLETMVLDPLVERLQERVRYVAPEPLSLPEPDEPFAAVMSPMDLHFGKLGREGLVQDPYDRSEARRRLRAGTESLLRDVSLFGRPDEILVGMASDWFHVDNVYKGTTKGTPQDTDGHVWQIIDEGVDLAVEFVSRLCQTGSRVRLVMVRGNHDSFATMFLFKALQLVFGGDERVDFVADPRERTYIQYGSTLFGFTHGDHWSQSRTPNKILTEPPRELLANTVDRVWFTGHKHFERFQNDNGVFWYQLPSLSGDDQYHDDEGYTGARKSLSAFIVREESGLVCNLLASHKVS